MAACPCTQAAPPGRTSARSCSVMDLTPARITFLAAIKRGCGQSGAACCSSGGAGSATCLSRFAAQHRGLTAIAYIQLLASLNSSSALAACQLMIIERQHSDPLV